MTVCLDALFCFEVMVMTVCLGFYDMIAIVKFMISGCFRNDFRAMDFFEKLVSVILQVFYNEVFVKFGRSFFSISQNNSETATTNPPGPLYKGGITAALFYSVQNLLVLCLLFCYICINNINSSLRWVANYRDCFPTRRTGQVGKESFIFYGNFHETISTLCLLMTHSSLLATPSHHLPGLVLEVFEGGHVWEHLAGALD